MVNRLRKLRKIRLHREGTHILVWSAVALLALNVIVIVAFEFPFVQKTWHYVPVIALLTVSLIVYGAMVNFFRCPPRVFDDDTVGVVVAPADGKVVVVEEVYEGEYFHDTRLMISIFMNILDVHANWIPVSGKVRLVRHHEGNYHCAWLPKASVENERSTVVITTPEGVDVLVRQVAGAVARRVVTYLQEGESYEIDEHLGFIKFGSRVDVYLPVGSRPCVRLGQRATGNNTVIARLG